MTAIAEPVAAVATRVDTGLYPDLQRFGATDISACFSCGTCTASCPLSKTDSAFPRRIIRYAQVGMKDALLSSKELWSCYQCGECAETCPTQADPSEFMAAARRYAIASYDRTRIAWTMYTRPIGATVFAVLLAAFFALFMYSAHGPQSGESLAIFEFIPEELIHNTGIVVMLLVVLAGIAGIASMARAIGRREGVGAADRVRQPGCGTPLRARRLGGDRPRVPRARSSSVPNATRTRPACPGSAVGVSSTR